MHKLLNIHGINKYSDTEVVAGLQAHNHAIEEWFYDASKKYFMNHFNEIFFDKTQKENIFQDSFIRLWTQIENGEISTYENTICRKQKDGCIKPMTCSLNTFLFAIAKNEYREILRNNKDIYVDQYFDKCDSVIIDSQYDEDEIELKSRVVDECIQMMPSRCLEILTLFYIEGKTLDEIMVVRKDKNTSKVGLKSAKYKCMNTLREKITQMFNKLDLSI